MEGNQKLYSSIGLNATRVFEVIVEEFTSVDARAAEVFASLAVLHDLPSIASPVLINQHTLEFEKFHFQAVSEGEIQRIVMFFQSNKVPVHDKVPMSVIKDALPWILPALTDIVNHSLLSSVFPASWKISQVVVKFLYFQLCQNGPL